MTLSDFEWISKIFDDTKHRAASLRQQSYLFSRWANPRMFGQLGGYPTLPAQHFRSSGILLYVWQSGTLYRTFLLHTRPGAQQQQFQTIAEDGPISMPLLSMPWFCVMYIGLDWSLISTVTFSRLFRTSDRPTPTRLTLLEVICRPRVKGIPTYMSPKVKGYTDMSS